jgi:hypothetical protein
MLYYDCNFLFLVKKKSLHSFADVSKFQTTPNPLEKHSSSLPFSVATSGASVARRAPFLSPSKYEKCKKTQHQKTAKFEGVLRECDFPSLYRAPGMRIAARDDRTK